MQKFDYYIFIDYSENLIGYNIIEKEKIGQVLEKITKLKHYKDVKNKKAYLHAIKKLFSKEKIINDFMKTKIISLHKNLEMYSEILEFINRNNNSIIFISVDNNQYTVFSKRVNSKCKVVKESDLKKGSIEHKLSLVIDNALNLKRKSK